MRAAKERERELRELDRDTRTVFAYNLNLRAEERDMFALFASAGAAGTLGRVCIVLWNGGVRMAASGVAVGEAS